MAELRESSDRPPIEELVRLNEIAAGPWSGEASIAVRNIERWSEQHLGSLVAYAIGLERKARAFDLIAGKSLVVKPVLSAKGWQVEWAVLSNHPEFQWHRSPDLLTAIENADKAGKEASHG